MAPHSSTLAWKIPWIEEPGGLQSMGSLELDTTEVTQQQQHYPPKKKTQEINMSEKEANTARWFINDSMEGLAAIMMHIMRISVDASINYTMYMCVCVCVCVYG